MMTLEANLWVMETIEREFGELKGGIGRVSGLLVGQNYEQHQAVLEQGHCQSSETL